MPTDVIDYSNTVFYKIYCKDPAVKDVYVGHTTNFVQRKYQHKRTCIKENDVNHHCKVYKFIRENGGWDNWKMEMIGYKDCYDHYEARKTEQNYFETLKATLNSIEPLPKPKPRPAQMPKETKEKALIVHEESNKHKCNVNRQPMNFTPNVAKKFVCEKCNFKCSKKGDYNRHLSTPKHKRNTNGTKKTSKNITRYTCSCGKTYKVASGLWKHKNKCPQINNTVVVQENQEDKPSMMDIISQNKEIVDLLVLQNEELKRQNKEQSNTIRELIPKIGNNNNNITKNSGII